MEFTDEMVKEINSMIDSCKSRQQEYGVCREALYPCEKVIDDGACPMILEYLRNYKKEHTNGKD